MHRRPFLSSLAAASVLVLALASSALGAPAHRTVQILDNCDGPSFNAALGEGACVREGGMSFETFGAMLAKGGASSWRFAPGRATLAAGGTVTAINRGGEFHTFTEVAAFGGGCVPPLNEALGLTPVPECSVPGLFESTGVPAGASWTSEALDAGRHLFQCLIHPWQRTTITAS
jgi:plastocyanin